RARTGARRRTSRPAASAWDTASGTCCTTSQESGMKHREWETHDHCAASGYAGGATGCGSGRGGALLARLPIPHSRFPPLRMDPQLALTTDMKIVLGLVGLTMILFVCQRVRADLVALVVLVMLGLTGLVQPEDLFNGFSSNAVISVIATMILGMGLDRTGA